MKTRRGKIILSDMTPPVKAVDTKDGRICCRCLGAAQPMENFPKAKALRGSTCKKCLNESAAEKRRQKKNDFNFLY